MKNSGATRSAPRSVVLESPRDSYSRGIRMNHKATSCLVNGGRVAPQPGVVRSSYQTFIPC
ncbi:hypothetical protein E2C01_070975 [Portunus trituberculatus]|uniref:Uncharacterized protein n=1 Tax=Portunus trituberculatus TaxID=210409 RepID=A0A5B7I3Z9_PORTR|nr:hypothetical protein [Portunus trituberculatus]